jgi:NitT/TauT family transport system substrate-binding protein
MHSLARGAAIGLLCLGAALHAPLAAEPATVRFGSVGGLTDAGLYLADEYGFFTAAGVTVAMQRIPNAPTLLTAIATDQLDVAGISVTPGLFAAVTQGINLRIVGDKQSVGPGFAATRLVIRSELMTGSKDAAITGLKGKSIAISARAATPFMDLTALFAHHGFGTVDTKIVELAYPNMMPALVSGAVDAAIVLEPFLTQAIQTGAVKEASDLIEPGTKPGTFRITVPIVYSEKFAQNRAAAQAFMTAYMQGVRRYNDAFVKGIDKDKVIAIVARHAGLDAKLVGAAFPAGLDPNQRVNRASLEACQKFFLDQHFMAAPVAIDKIYDPSFAKAAVAQLGDYH